ncbi:uncharacterized protein ACRADG_012823 [Cochliomyia hominivorax]
MTSNKPSNSRSTDDNASDFETAIAACGFGRFNICLIIVSMAPLISGIFATSSLSFVLPTAECDLQLSLMDKGLLNAICFAGMIVSAIPWGFISDTMGRKRVLVTALLLDGIIVVCTGTSQTVDELLAFKFFDGFLVSGPFAVAVSYVTEFHDLKHRARIMMSLGMIKASATIILPIIASLILPHRFTFNIYSYKFYTWHVFITVTAIFPLLGSLLHALLPESPKFLMSQGRNKEALECLRSVYAINNRRPKSDYPISNLLDEDPHKSELFTQRSRLQYKQTHKTLAHKRQHARERLSEGIQQLKPMCSILYLKQSSQVFCMLFCILLGLNSIRLWLPQIFVIMTEFQENEMIDSSMCNVLLYNYNKTQLLVDGEHKTFCDLESINTNSYVDNIVVACFSLIIFMLVTLVVNKLGNNIVLRTALCLSFLSGISLYFSNSHLMTLILASIFVGSSSVSATTVINVSVILFPTNIRTMVVILVMTFGRCGSLLGNILFPYFISLGCVPPFVLIGSVMTVSFILSLFLPNTNQIALK